MKIKFKNKRSFSHIFSFTFAMLALSACSADKTLADTGVEQGDAASAQSVQRLDEAKSSKNTQDTDRLSVQAQAFFHAFLSLNQDVIASGHFNLQIPAIWVFSPQGELTQMVAGDDALDAFSKEFAAVDPDAPKMTCGHVEATVAKATGEQWNLGCAGGKWTALLLVGTNECPNSCPRYEAMAAQAGQVHLDTLQTKTLVISSGP